MSVKKVYIVRCLNGTNLTVHVDGKQVPMDEFLQAHTPVQVTSLTSYNPDRSLDAIGLMIAEEHEEPTTTTVSW